MVGLFRNPAHPGRHFGPAAGIGRIAHLEARHEIVHVRIVISLIQQVGTLLRLDTLVDKQGGIAAVIHDQVGTAAIGPGQRHFGAPPVFFQAFPFQAKTAADPLWAIAAAAWSWVEKNVAAGPADVSPPEL